MNSGIIENTENGIKNYSDAEIMEQIKLVYMEWQMEQYVGRGDNKTVSGFMQTRLRDVLQNDTVVVEEESVVFTVSITIKGVDKRYIFNHNTGKESILKDLKDCPEITASTNNSAVTENSRYISGNYTAVILAGYAISNVTTEPSIENGLVITKDGNKWVWIPVNSNDLASTYEDNSNGWVMSGTGEGTEIEAVVTNYRTVGSQTRGNPGDTSVYR